MNWLTERTGFWTFIGVLLAALSTTTLWSPTIAWQVPLAVFGYAGAAVAFIAAWRPAAWASVAGTSVVLVWSTFRPAGFYRPEPTLDPPRQATLSSIETAAPFIGLVVIWSAIAMLTMALRRSIERREQAERIAARYERLAVLHGLSLDELNAA